MSLLLTGIGRLVTHDDAAGEIVDGAMIVVAGRVVWTGSQKAIPGAAADERLDLEGRCVIPGFVDSHTHLVFAGDRAGEFEARLSGRSYSAGGIASTVAATREATDDDLVATMWTLATEAAASGTTTMEIKSGYGLTVADESRSLEAAAFEDPTLPRRVRTFLGAHVVPPEYEGRDDEYVDLVCSEMLDACAPLAEWCDVFCDDGAFDADQSRAILQAGRRRGLGLRIHANQLGPGPGARLAADLGAASADHLSHLDDTDIAALADAGVVATLLPAAELSTRSAWAPARRLLDAGATVALASDCNPGSSYTTNMPLVVALGCLLYGMTPAEALRAATLGGARALGLDDVGHLGVGARADLAVLDAPSPVHLAYRPGVPLVSGVMIGGIPLRWPPHD